MRGWRRRWRWRECSREVKRILERSKRHQAIKACAHPVGCSLTCAYGTKLKRVLRRADGLGRTNAAAQGRKQVLVGISFPVPSCLEPMKGSSPFRSPSLSPSPLAGMVGGGMATTAGWAVAGALRFATYSDARDRGPHGPRRGRGRAGRGGRPPSASPRAALATNAKAI